MAVENIDDVFRIRWRTGIPLFNALARIVRWHRPLDADWIMARAISGTGLEKWGSPDIREPLERIVNGYEGSNLLTPFGRHFLRKLLVYILSTRLRVEGYIRKHPEIHDEPVKGPVFIVGLPRSGTTLLYHVLALDPGFRALRIHETFNPVDGQPPGPLRSRFDAWTMDMLLPGLKAIHPRSPLRIEECTWLLAYTLYAPGAFSLFAPTGDYEEWLLEQPEETWRSVYRLYRQQLQVLQHWSGRSRWLLKSPAHVSNIEHLMHVFPDARIIMPQRSMNRVFPSMASLFATMRTLCCEPVGTGEEWRRMLDMTCRAQNRLPGVIERYQDSIMQIDFDALLNNTRSNVLSIYDWLEIEPPPDFTDRLAEYRKRDTYKKGEHSYSVEQFGLQEHDIDTACKIRVS